MKSAFVIKTDGTWEKRDKKLSLKEMQEIVGGYIEIVYLPGKAELVVNEEGKYICPEENKLASAMVKDILQGDIIMGNVIWYPDGME